MHIDSLLDLSGEVAVVTGAGAGIGRAIAERLAEAGAAVVVSDLDAATAAEVADAIRAAGGSAAALACDVTSEEDRAATVDVALGTFGAPTILVNNAGGGGPKPFDMPLEQFGGRTGSTCSQASASASWWRRTWRRRATAPSSTSARWPARTRTTA